MTINFTQILKTAALIPACLLFSESSAMAEGCTAAPSCASLGYSQSASDCPSGGIKCPFDTSKYYCPAKKAPECPTGYYKDCAAVHNYWKNDTNYTTRLSDGTTCYQCRSYDCTDYRYLNTMPSSSMIGTGCNGKMYNSCSTTTVAMPSSTGTSNRTCYNCIDNPYGTGRSLLRYCSSTYCCGSGSSGMSCANVESGIGGCIKY